MAPPLGSPARAPRALALLLGGDPLHGPLCRVRRRWLLVRGGRELSGIGPSRRNVRLDALRANEFLVGLATTSCRLPVLRTYWYDGARDRIPTAEHQAISDLPNVKLRLGRLNQRHQQKEWMRSSTTIS